MNSGKIVAGVAGANATVQAGTEAAAPAVPFLDAHLWVMVISGTPAVMTPQALIVVTTGLLSVIALLASIFKRAKT